MLLNHQIKCFIAAGIIFLITSCGDLEKKEEESNINIGDKVDFSGYVQKAFTITVNSKTFNDSENFYTRFINELILSDEKYEALKTATITLDGQYGMNEFGKNSKVFMSSEASEGHLFESVTDSNSKFIVKVTASALDETFKARVIIRIGLQIKYPDNSNTEKFCYILHGTKDSIRISETSKPIIFDDFLTQLNTYNCESVKESELIIPTSRTSGDSGNTIVPEGTTTTTDASGNTVIEPHINVTSTIKITSPLNTQEVGDNTLLGAFFDSTGYYFIKKAVKNSENGEYHQPLITLSSLESPSVSQVNISRASSNSSNMSFFVKYNDNFILFDPIGNLNQVSTSGGSVTQLLALGLFNLTTGLPIFKGSSLKFIGSNRGSIYDMDFNSSAILVNPKHAPSSNKLSVPSSKGGIYFNDSLYLLFPSSTSSSIGKFNDNLVEQKSYVISKLSIPSADLANSFLIADTTGLIIVQLKNDELILKRIELVE